MSTHYFFVHTYMFPFSIHVSSSYYNAQGWTRTDAIALGSMGVTLYITLYRFITTLKDLPPAMNTFKYSFVQHFTTYSLLMPVY
jgi:hypothetical protein